jgi:integrase
MSTRERSRRRAEQKVLDWIQGLEAARNEEVVVEGPLFKNAFQEWLDLKDIRASTLADYTTTFNGVFIPAFGKMFVDEITFEDIELFLNKTRKKRKLSSRTQQKHLTLLRSFFKWAIRRRYTRANPTEGIRVARGAKRLGVALTVEEARRLVEACHSSVVQEVTDSRRENWTQEFRPPEHLFVAVLIALYTALRRGNLLTLTWRDVDLSRGKITIPAERMKANADHQIPIHEDLSVVLKQVLRKRGRYDPDELVLGKELLTISSSFKTALKRADLPDIRWHDLRHTTATWLSARCSYACLRQLLGHSPGNIVTLYYTHVPFEELRSAIDSLPSLISPLADITAVDSETG